MYTISRCQQNRLMLCHWNSHKKNYICLQAKMGGRKFFYELPTQSAHFGLTLKDKSQSGCICVNHIPICLHYSDTYYSNELKMCDPSSLSFDRNTDFIAMKKSNESCKSQTLITLNFSKKRRRTKWISELAKQVPVLLEMTIGARFLQSKLCSLLCIVC